MDAPPVASRGQVVTRAATLALLGSAVWLLAPYLPGLIGAGVLCVIALPVVRQIDPRRRGRLAPFAVMMLLVVMLVLPGVWLLAALLAQIPDAWRSLGESGALGRLMALRLGSLHVGTVLDRATAEIISWSSRQTLAAFGGAVTALMNLVVALFGAYYMLTSGEAAWTHVRHLLPFPAEASDRLLRRFRQVTEGMLIGVVLTGAAQGTLVGLAFSALGLQQPVLWGAVTAAVSVLPVFGSALVWLPAVGILFARGEAASAVVLGVIGAVVISNLDNLLRIVVYRRVSRVHPMVTLLGAFSGVSAFGMAGLLVGPLLLCYLLELLRNGRATDPMVIESAA